MQNEQKISIQYTLLSNKNAVQTMQALGRKLVFIKALPAEPQTILYRLQCGSDMGRSSIKY
jgi:hypothetical protein